MPPPPPPPAATPSPDPVVPHCYRHPNREAGRSCTRCGKPACSECLVQAAVGSHCIDCARAARPDVKTRVRMANARVLTPATYAIIGANVAVFMWMVLLDPKTLSNDITQAHVDLGLSKSILEGDYAQFGIPGDEWYRLVTSGFIHFGVFHLLMNMLLLFQLGMIVERALGPWKFTLLYFASLLAGSLGVLILDDTGRGVAISGGASGAVFGVMAGAAVGLHRRGVNVFNTGIGTTLILNLVLTFAISYISKGGHLGGAIGGALCGWVMLAPEWRPQPKWMSWAAPIAVGAGSVIASVMLVS